jgi:exodeoxyribonuclease VII large subunit
LKALSVTEVNNQIKSIIESHFEIVLVEGEVSKAVYHSSGHLYFTLKDKNSSIGCAMWKSNLSRMKFRVKEGEKVTVYGALSVYVPRGEYKIIAQSIEPSGVGALQRAYEQLKEELSKLGYFDESRKKPLPKFPKRIAIVTSSTGAALQDMLRVASKRWLLSELYLFNALVQGEGAAEDIAFKIKTADEYVFEDGRGFDLIITGRGGGSKEDLWPFNERVVADAIFNAKTPVISAVGHEIDYLISDFVSDIRAATPSNAMEIALPDKNEILLMLDEMRCAYEYKYKHIVQKKEKELLHLKEMFNLNSPVKKLNVKLEECEYLLKRFYNLSLAKVRQKEQELLNLQKAFETLNPKKREKKGFGEIIKNGKRVDLNELNTGDVFALQNTEVSVVSRVIDKISN